MKVYKIIDVVVSHPTEGSINKKNIQYFDGEDLESQEFYHDGMNIRSGYIEFGVPTKKIKLDNIDIDTMKDEDLQSIANKLKQYLK